MRTTRTKLIVMSALIANCCSTVCSDDNLVTDVAGITRIDVYPATVQLNSARGRAQIIVTGHFEDRSTRDVTSLATMRVGDSEIATLERAQVTAKKDGETTVEIQ